ncbi:MAG: AMP-binding protein [Pseudomonadota bacterium]
MATIRNAARREKAPKQFNELATQDTSSMQPSVAPAPGLFARFRQQFARFSDKSALVLPDGSSVRYSELDSQSAQIANALTELGVEPGDRITAQIEKSVDGLCLYLACSRAGFVFHPMNTGYLRNELEFFLQDAEPRVVVCDEPSHELFATLCGESITLLTLGGDDGGNSGDNSEGDSGASLTGLCAHHSSEHEPFPAREDSPAALLYSSGTTGVPKGILLTNRNLLSNASTLVEAWGFTSDDVLLHALPIYHVHGLFVAIHCALLSGSTMYWLARFDLDAVLASLPRCTVMMGVPTYYTRLLSDGRFSRDHCQNLRLFISGSAPLLAETFQAFEQRSGHRILERYGMSETGMLTSNPLAGNRVPGTVGHALPGVDVRVVSDAGMACEYPEVGNVQVAGPNVFSGYWKRPDKTAEDMTRDGFFNTGDLGQLDRDGRLTIVGRAKDLVITGGLNVYPKEVELIIDELPGVLESAVIGVPHDDFGEAVVAVVVAEVSGGESGDERVELSEREMLGLLSDQLAAFKRPKRIVFADCLPRNAMGKVQKNLLREAHADLFRGA